MRTRGTPQVRSGNGRQKRVFKRKRVQEEAPIPDRRTVGIPGPSPSASFILLVPSLFARAPFTPSFAQPYILVNCSRFMIVNTPLFIHTYS